jgi:hypothetical protein
MESHGSSRTRTPLLAITLPPRPLRDRVHRVTIDPNDAPSNPAHDEPRAVKPLHPPKQPPKLSPADRICHLTPDRPKTTQFQPSGSNLLKSAKRADIKVFARPPTRETPSSGISASLELAIAPVPTRISRQISYLQAPRQGPHRRFATFSHPVPVSECLTVHTPSLGTGVTPWCSQMLHCVPRHSEMPSKPNSQRQPGAFEAVEAFEGWSPIAIFGAERANPDRRDR